MHYEDQLRRRNILSALAGGVALGAVLGLVVPVRRAWPALSRAGRVLG